ncbi:hypothetical protein GCM10027568_25320 [Humibacter soli]
MWSTEYTAEADLQPEAVWAALRALHEGRLTYEGADDFALHGPFAVGTRVSVTPAGQETFDSTIVDLVEGRTYADETIFGDLTLTFRHTLEATEGGTRVTHRLEIDGVSADEIGPELGEQIAGDFPESMAQLFAAAASPELYVIGEQAHDGEPARNTGTDD